MTDLFDKLRMEAGPLAKYAHLPEDYFFFPKLDGDITPRMNSMEERYSTVASTTTLDWLPWRILNR